MRMKSFTFVVWSIAAACLLCVLWLVVQRLQQIDDATPHPVERKLTDLEGAFSTTSFIVPPDAYWFSFVIGVSNLHAVAPNASGTLSLLSEGKEVYRHSFTPQQLTPCNWLDQHGLQGYIVDWQQNRSPAEALAPLQSGLSYTVEVRFDQPSAVPISLWLCYIQSWKTYRNTRATN